MADELVEVFAAAGQVEANLVKSLLEAAEIPVLVVQEGAGAAYGFTVGPMGRATVLVPQAYASAARDLVESLWRGEAGEDAEPGGGEADG